MTIVKKYDSFTYQSARGDADVVRPADVVGVTNPDGTPLIATLANEFDSLKQEELLLGIDRKLGALLVLMANAFAPGDTPESFLAAAEKEFRSN